MLVLSRKLKDAFWLNDNIRISIERITGNQVRVGIEAPGDVLILREELKDQADRGRREEDPDAAR